MNIPLLVAFAFDAVAMLAIPVAVLWATRKKAER